MRTDEQENLGLQLLKKSHRGILRLIFSRTGLVTVLLLINFGVLFAIFFRFSSHIFSIYSVAGLFTAGMVFYLINSRLDPSAKLTWLVIIALLPIFGALFYLFTLSDFGHRAMTKRLRSITEETCRGIAQDPDVFSALEREDKGDAALASYLAGTGCHPVYDKCEVEYFPSGEEKYRAMLRELEKAEHFIFLEYFIVDEGVMWGNVLDILARKVKEGVEVRMIYDGSCEFTVLPRNYPRMLSQLGIKCRVFSPVTPFVSTHYNYRDHRKILVIDGHTAFTGGVNLADEYINRISRFGHWKDTAVMLRGEAVKSFTLMFLQLWSIEDRTTDLGDYLSYPACPREKANGFVIPYGDSPLDKDRVGHQVYLDIINRAEKYLHIMSPYLILDAEMENALCFAARRGVDVSLILPGIPDKATPYALAKTHYSRLMESGVKIYEYSPGFVHAKVFVCDDIKAVVGTINLDYRSLSHHFECALYMHGTDCIADIEQDFARTRSKCRLVTEELRKKEKFKVKLTGWLLKIFAPLM